MNEIVITIPAVPPTCNTMWRKGISGRIYLTEEAKAWRNIVGLVARSVRTDWKFFEVVIEIWMPNQRLSDVDNRIKPTLDALTASKVWEDDSQVAFVSCEYVGVDKQSPRTVIRLRERTSKFRFKPTSK